MHLLKRGRVGEVPLVVLHDVGELGEFVALLGQVRPEVVEALDVGLHPLDLAVGYEDDTVHALQDELAAGVVEHLPRHGV